MSAELQTQLAQRDERRRRADEAAIAVREAQRRLEEAGGLEVAAELVRQDSARRKAETEAAEAVARRQRATAELAACAEDLSAAKTEKAQLVARLQEMLVQPNSQLHTGVTSRPNVTGAQALHSPGKELLPQRRQQQTQGGTPVPIDPSADTFEI